VIDHMVNHDGLHQDRNSVPETGKIVFICRPREGQKAAPPPAEGRVE
jgi:hypothetical protein